MLDEEPRRFKFMLLPMEGAGHLLSLLGLAHRLYRRYHHVTFCVGKAFSKYLIGCPCNIRLLDDPYFLDYDDPQERWAHTTVKHSVHFFKNPEQQFDLQSDFNKEFVATVMHVNDQIAEVIAQEKPDFIFVDYYVAIPAVITSGIPWANVQSANPLCIYSALDGPPYYSGYSKDSRDEKKWESFNEIQRIFTAEALTTFQPYCLSKNVVLPEGSLWMESPYMNIYVYPKDCDYTEVSPTPPERWYRVDHFIRPMREMPLGFDEKRLSRRVPIIYFSLGTMGSADLLLMKRLLEFMKLTPFQYIISKGPNHAKYELPENCVGGQYIDQLRVLPFVDMVIFHGGNNTFVECCYYGKPMIILPLFGDQFDNALRCTQKFLGLSFRPYQVDLNSFKGAIHYCLTNPKIIKACEDMAKHMQASVSHEPVIKMAEKICSRYISL